MIKKVFICF